MKTGSEILIEKIDQMDGFFDTMLLVVDPSCHVERKERKDFFPQPVETCIGFPQSECTVGTFR